MLFAHLKRILKLDRLRLRGPNGAREEFTLAATAQNLRKMAKRIPMQSLNPAYRPPEPLRRWRQYIGITAALFRRHRPSTDITPPLSRPCAYPQRGARAQKCIPDDR